MKTELSVSSDRVIVECEELDTENRTWGFMIHILDDQNTVVTAAQGNQFDKKLCFERLRKTERILHEGKKIYIAGMGRLNQPRTASKWTYTFPRLGTFVYNGRSFHFMAIANERGHCMDAYAEEGEPCPDDPFPIADHTEKAQP